MIIIEAISRLMIKLIQIISESIISTWGEKINIEDKISVDQIPVKLLI